MKHVKAFLLKFISCLVLLYIILGLYYGMSFGMVFLISLTLGAASYILGDFLVLPRTNNFIATITDFVLAFLVIWSLSISLTLRENLVTMSLVAATGVALFEILFHRYMANRIITNMKTSSARPRPLQFQTEASEELTPSKSDLYMNENNTKREDE